MAEIELSALRTQCLNRRIPDTATLRTEVAAWETERNEIPVSIDWQFTADDTRTKLHSFIQPSRRKKRIRLSTLASALVASFVNLG